MDEGTLVYSAGSFSSNLKAIDLAGAPQAAVYPTSDLTSGTATNVFPAISPDGETIVFERVTGASETEIYMQATRGGPAQLVTRLAGFGAIGTPATSRDGSQVAFYEFGNEKRTTLVVLDIAAGRVSRLPAAANNVLVGWSPDGQQIMTTGVAPDRLTLVNLRDSSEVSLEIECGTICTLGRGEGLFAGVLAVSPDGSRIALPAEDGLWVVALEESKATRITEERDAPLSWTDDWIYFARQESAESGKSYPVVYRILPKGGAPRLYARLPEDCDPLYLALSLDASTAVCAVIEQRPDAHIVENFDRTGR